MMMTLGRIIIPVPTAVSDQKKNIQFQDRRSQCVHDKATLNKYTSKQAKTKYSAHWNMVPAWTFKTIIIIERTKH